ncbi:MAG TPA: PilT/PilU family type 4a pilus ATPase [Gemmatimonadaceae bacterium]|nr:PilT/PilU family type 4a pilus ATPase [Gemmatimonadaceae bacterium]
MPQLDRFLSVLVSNRATALLLAADDVARLEIGDAPRPVTKQPLSSQQLVALLREIAPADAAHQLDTGEDAAFTYTSSDGTFLVRVTGAALELTAEIRPAASAQGAKDAPRSATPVATRAAEPPAPAERTHTPAASTVAVGATTTPTDDAARVEIDTLLRTLISRGASDLHLRAGEPPIYRTHGEMERLDGAATLTSERIDAMLHAIMPDRNKREFGEVNDTDFAHEIAGVARFRGNALKDRKGAAAVFRAIPANVVTVDQLGISEEVQRLCYLTKGLVLVTGPTGSGKSTTLCALIDLINRVRTDHVITIEDPIEFVHENKSCIITQRQVGVHTSSFKHALRAALREDPDIVLVGEMRDLETVSIAIETAETGHLVFGTLHTTSAVSTVDRIIDQFPADRQEQIRMMLSESLRGVISQVLCKKIGGGRVAAREILLSLPAVSNLIREGKTFQIPSVMQTSRRLGMLLLNDALIDLVNDKQVEPKEAYLKASDKLGFINLLKQHGHDVSFLEVSDASAPPPKTPEKPAAHKGGGRPVGAGK